MSEETGPDSLSTVIRYPSGDAQVCPFHITASSMSLAYSYHDEDHTLTTPVFSVSITVHTFLLGIILSESYEALLTLTEGGGRQSSQRVVSWARPLVWMGKWVSLL